MRLHDRQSVLIDHCPLLTTPGVRTERLEPAATVPDTVASSDVGHVIVAPVAQIDASRAASKWQIKTHTVPQAGLDSFPWPS